MQYFKHMSDMAEDGRVKRLSAEYGLEGYGLYCLILERITHNLTSESINPDLEETSDDIARFFNCNGPSERIEEIARFIIDQGLLEIDIETLKLTCPKVFKFYQASQTRSPVVKKLIKNWQDFRAYKLSVSDSHRQSQTENGAIPGNNGDSAHGFFVCHRRSQTLSDGHSENRTEENREVRNENYELNSRTKGKAIKANEQEDRLNEDGYVEED